MELLRLLLLACPQPQHRKKTILECIADPALHVSLLRPTELFEDLLDSNRFNGPHDHPFVAEFKDQIWSLEWFGPRPHMYSVLIPDENFSVAEAKEDRDVMAENEYNRNIVTMTKSLVAAHHESLAKMLENLSNDTAVFGYAFQYLERYILPQHKWAFGRTRDVHNFMLLLDLTREKEKILYFIEEERHETRGRPPETWFKDTINCVTKVVPGPVTVQTVTLPLNHFENGWALLWCLAPVFFLGKTADELGSLVNKRFEPGSTKMNLLCCWLQACVLCGTFGGKGFKTQQDMMDFLGIHWPKHPPRGSDPEIRGRGGGGRTKGRPRRRGGRER